jgi:hypothetical protein
LRVRYRFQGVIGDAEKGATTTVEFVFPSHQLERQVRTCHAVTDRYYLVFVWWCF